MHPSLSARLGPQVSKGIWQTWHWLDECDFSLNDRYPRPYIGAMQSSRCLLVMTLLVVACGSPPAAKAPRNTAAAIVQAGHPVLRVKAAEVPAATINTPEFQQLLARMIRTMREAPGVGLAAPQIGVSQSVFVLEDRAELMSKLTEGEKRERLREPFAVRVFVNPVVKPIGEARATFFEGCLSVSGFAGLVERAAEVEVSGLDEHAQPQTWRVRGWPARILQHEYDHLQGTLYVDRMHTRSFSTAEHAKARFAGKPIAEILQVLGVAAPGAR